MKPGPEGAWRSIALGEMLLAGDRRVGGQISRVAGGYLKEQGERRGSSGVFLANGGTS